MGEEGLAKLQVGELYARKVLHTELALGGELQRGISYPATGSHVLLFSHAPNEEFGYHDGWADQAQGVYRFSGMWFGNGPMELSRGNLAILERSPELHLFVRSGSRYRYEGRFECVDYENVTGRNPSSKSAKAAFVFVLRRASSPLPAALLQLSEAAVARSKVVPGVTVTVRAEAFQHLEADPDTRRLLLEKALGGHRTLVERLARSFSEGGAECSEDPRSYDLLAEWSGGLVVLVEVKTLPPWTLGRIRQAVGQLLEYEHRITRVLGIKNPVLALATDRRIEPAWLLDYLVKVRRMVVLYPEADAICAVGDQARKVASSSVGIKSAGV